MNHEQGCRPGQIKEIRKRLNLSQEEFAKKLGVSFTSVNRWENSQAKPSKLAQRQIMNLLEQTREYAISNTIDEKQIY